MPQTLEIHNIIISPYIPRQSNVPGLSIKEKENYPEDTNINTTEKSDSLITEVVMITINF